MDHVEPNYIVLMILAAFLVVLGATGWAFYTKGQKPAPATYASCKQYEMDRNTVLFRAVEWSSRRTGTGVTCTKAYEDLEGRTVCVVHSNYKHWNYIVACNQKDCKLLRKKRPLGWDHMTRYCDHNNCEVVQKKPVPPERRKQGDEK